MSTLFFIAWHLLVISATIVIQHRIVCEGCRIYEFNSVLQTVAVSPAQHAEEYHSVAVVTVSALACMCTCGWYSSTSRVYYRWYWDRWRRTHQHTSSDLQ